jgi:phosphoserine aminotransferase
MKRPYNFSAGPAILPESVVTRAQAALRDLDDTGIGVMEHSHRGAAFTRVITEAEERCRRIAGIPDDYAVLFLQGGASTQFFMLPANLLGGGTADYIDTGAWSKKAIKEARLYGTVNVAGSSADEGYSYIPSADQIQYSDAPAYVHFTSNNTIAGTEWATEPTPPAGAPLACDASSDIFSRPIDVSKYGVLYAGAQKNLGPSGVTLVVIRRDLVDRAASDLPTMLQYRTHADKGSMFNTPPTFAIYVLGEVLRWIEELGGLAAMAEYNRSKAHKLYDFLDDSELFQPTARPGSRSLMNVCFRTGSDDKDAAFIDQATAAGLLNLKGHRSVGGMRASIYNAFPEEGVTALVDFMKAFERDNR